MNNGSLSYLSPKHIPTCTQFHFLLRCSFIFPQPHVPYLSWYTPRHLQLPPTSPLFSRSIHKHLVTQTRHPAISSNCVLPIYNCSINFVDFSWGNGFISHLNSFTSWLLPQLRSCSLVSTCLQHSSPQCPGPKFVL